MVALVLPASSAFIFKCIIRTDNWEHIGEHYKCSVPGINSTTENDIAKELTVDYGKFTNVTYDDIKVVDIYLKFCFYVPLGINAYFKNIEGLSISKSRLREIKKNDFEEMPKLKFLKVFGNEIETLDDDVFDFTPSIKWLSIWDNKIQKIGQATFDRTPLVERISLTWNKCINESSEDRNMTVRLIAKLKVRCK